MTRPALLLALALAASAAAAPLASADGPAWHTWTGTAPAAFRTQGYSGHELVRTGALFQALGADADGLARRDYYKAVLTPSPADPTLASRDLYNAITYDFFGAHRATHDGDVQLPRDDARWPDGTGEVTEVRFAVEGDALFVRLRWNAMPRPDAQVATLTFAPAGAAALPRPWPGGARLSSTWSTALTLWGTGGAVTGPRGTSALPATSVRTGDHTTEARLPLSALPAGPWTVGGGSGLHDAARPGSYLEVAPGQATATTPGSGGPTSPTNVLGLLFAREDPATLDELQQSKALAAGTGDGHTAVVDPALLRSGTGPAAAEPTGTFSRVLESRLFQRDGITRSGDPVPETRPAPVPVPLENPGLDTSFFYTGRQQRYDVHVPARYPSTTGRWPLIVYLHGFTGLPEEPFRNPVGLVEEADRRGYLVASALGRGDHYYREEGELDVLEVLADVSRRYRVDPDRVYLMGHSMGGYGTNNVATRHPDLFAAVAPAQGTDSTELVGNLRHVPWYETTSEEDLDTGARDAKAHYAALSARGYDATLLDYSLKIHEYSSIYDGLPRLFSFFAAHRRVVDPAVVTWVRPTDDRPDLGLVHDGAYWVSGVRAASRTAPSEVTVESLAVPHRTATPAQATRTDARVDEGGPTGRTAAQLLQTVPARGVPAPRANAVQLAASGTSALTVDARRARLRLGRTSPLTVDGSTDRAVALTLTGLPAGRYAVTVDGRRTGTVTAARSVRVPVPAGRHRVVLTVPSRPAAGAATAPAATGTLPTTGGTAATAGLAALLAAAAVRRLRRAALS